VSAGEKNLGFFWKSKRERQNVEIKKEEETRPGPSTKENIVKKKGLLENKDKSDSQGGSSKGLKAFPIKKFHFIEKNQLIGRDLAAPGCLGREY